MDILNKLFKGKKAQEEKNDRGLLIYESVNDVIHAESVLKKAGFKEIRVVAPPPEYRQGCDLSIEFNIIEQVGIIRHLSQNDIRPETVIQVVEESMKPTEICSLKDFGEHVMIRAANMKISFEKSSLKIVNISGGGCSDVPYLAREMIGKTLRTALSPRETGYTLCAYTLAIAFEEARKRFL